MQSPSIIDQRRSSEGPATKTIDAPPRRSDRRMTTAQLSSGAWADGRRQLAMTHFQGDFACGQRTRVVAVVMVGSFAASRITTA